MDGEKYVASAFGLWYAGLQRLLNIKMDSQKQSVVDRIKQATNILVTVSNNPSVDQLAACIGLTLALNKYDKHGTAVFSGQVPSTIEFLQPEATIEKNTDSLRDFIISLDKSKADKLRYKVEENVVKIFITPYRTSITDQDLVFSQGDFNVDVVVALGVREQQDIDQAITAHGRILHDATVISINTAEGSELGTLNWTDPKASSLSEMTVSLIDAFDTKLVDNQIATALLTGIVAETARFSNEKTTPMTMSLSAQLMTAGADQQLIAAKLEEPAAPAEPEPQSQGSDAGGEGEDQQPEQHQDVAVSEDGTLEINHKNDDVDQAAQPEPKPESEEPKPANQIHVDEEGNLLLPEVQSADEQANGDAKEPEGQNDKSDEPSRLIMEPPSRGGQLTANSAPEEAETPVDALLLPPVEEGPKPEILRHEEPMLPQNDDQINAEADKIAQESMGYEHMENDTEKPSGAPPDVSVAQPTESEAPVSDEQTLAAIEEAVGSPHTVANDEPAAAPVTDAPADQPTQPQPPLVVIPPADNVAPADITPPVGEAPTDAAVPTPLIDADGNLQTSTAPVPTSPAPDSSVPGIPSVNSARDAVAAAIIDSPPVVPEPIQALNAQPLPDVRPPQQPNQAPTAPDTNGGMPLPNVLPPSPGVAPPAVSPADQPMTMPMPPSPSGQVISPNAPQNNDPNAPPPVPPPMMPPAW